MNRRNYACELSRIIEKQKILPSPYPGGKPTLLLHACCGPCSSSVLEYLVPHFDVTVLWYNPNLYPESEFDRRLSALRELIDKMNLTEEVKIIQTEWRSDEYRRAVAGFEDEPEGGARCARCFRLRLDECAKTAKALGFDFFGTTLTVSRHKDAALINAVGEAAAKAQGAVWLPSDFKKNGGENRSVELSEKLGIYRQVYCGCEFSYFKRISNPESEED